MVPEHLTSAIEATRKAGGCGRLILNRTYICIRPLHHDGICESHIDGYDHEDMRIAIETGDTKIAFRVLSWIVESTQTA